eukprot:TRINITY_DN112310_c0_g1_i1.p1 TRINITY_DN112310_c0_g1~~TRINITY_DN112310_c0_g1_i1.p1  ORF type:complete len:183 (+),score=24.85 TRINITY_DN112310_c0_g1_i1:74-550(+)
MADNGDVQEAGSDSMDPLAASAAGIRTFSSLLDEAPDPWVDGDGTSPRVPRPNLRPAPPFDPIRILDMIAGSPEEATFLVILCMISVFFVMFFVCRSKKATTHKSRPMGGSRKKATDQKSAARQAETIRRRSAKDKEKDLAMTPPEPAIMGAGTSGDD